MSLADPGAGQALRMNALTALEQYVARCNSAVWQALVPPRTKQAEVLVALRRYCDAHAMIVGRGRVLVPNHYVVQLPPPTYQQLDHVAQAVCHELSVCLRRHAAQQGYMFAGPVHVDLEDTRAEDEVDLFCVRGRVEPAGDHR
ncbi:MULTISPECIES: DUF3662 domain-containing protein [unclassified Streptomyces]|uniref:DUF3662 domain-containing protein n=1 Tax=unclassified Streptomyces TaxID=2593676 RepID=UPI000DB94ED0|nr:DUF3662 domain-containing protein [Streptomyces sp. PsTaAH-137]MYT73768.1 DUF3662 domain-containing protein [Streptomyces sp. SID8367]